MVLLLSGGLDSAVLLADLKSQGLELWALNIDYGQRHSRETRAAKRLAEKYSVPLFSLQLPQLRQLMGGSALTSESIPVPEGHYQEEVMKQTVVPNRNMVFLSLAASYALSVKAEGVAYAAHSGDHHIYPDCRPEFIQKVSEVLRVCDWHSVGLLTPYAQFSKGEILKRGIELGVPFEETWSCYQGGAEPCGLCGTCVERAEAFAACGIEDPLLRSDDQLTLREKRQGRL